MIPKSDACDPQLIEALLLGELDDAGERQLTGHLDVCEECRASLETRSSDLYAWNETGQLLREQPFDADSCFDASIETDELADEVAPFQPLLIRNVLDSLGPTDDPRMLGRLGGYEVSGVIGAGGMGVVLKAFDRSLDRTVAIKVLAPHLACSAAARKRFAREAKAAAAVLHPNVIAIHGVSGGDDASMLPFLVMPYIKGSSLQTRLDREGPLTVAEILRVASQIVEGLAAAHAQGLVHRDIKPANILLEEGLERVSITDFGLARAVDDATLTRSGVIAGTPQYMSPQQARGEPIDARSDLFSLGSVIYTMCTGHAPFRAETSHGVLRRITDDSPRGIRETNPDIPPWLCRLVNKLHAKSPDERYQSATRVAEVIQQCLAHVQTPDARLPRELRRSSELKKIIRPLTLPIAILIGAAAIGLTGYWLNQNDPQLNPAPVSPLDQPRSNTETESPVIAASPDLDWEVQQEPSLDTVIRDIWRLDAETQNTFEIGPEN